MIRCFFFSLITAVTVLSLSAPVYAQEFYSSISIQPLIVEMEIENVQSYIKKIKVVNTNSVPYEITFEAFDLEIDPSTRNMKLLPASSKKNRIKSLASWVVPEGDSVFVLQPKEEKDFEFQFGAPVEASPGDYYASLNFYYKPVGAAENGNISIRQSMGCLFLVSLLGENLETDQEPYDMTQVSLRRMADDTEVSIELLNNTLRFVQVRPSLSIRDEEGEVYFQKDGSSKRVFPGERSIISSSFPNIYLAAKERMTLDYTLWDRQKKLKLYEETVPLEVFRGASPPYFENLKSILQMSGGALLVLIIFLFLRKNRSSPTKTSRTSEWPKRKKKKLEI